jgi:hypothetical protein
MHAEMREIRQVSAMSLARVAAVYYALGGLLTLIIDLAIGMEKLTVPLGFFTLFLGLKLNFTYSRALWIPGIVSQLFFSTILYALTGWVSGFLSAIAYNFVSRHFNVRIKGAIDAHSTSESIQRFNS